MKITSQSFGNFNKETEFHVTDLNSTFTQNITASKLSHNNELLYALGSLEASRVGLAASNDFLNFSSFDKNQYINSDKSYNYYHILCVSYVTLILTGISIVRRLFPFHIPFTDLTIPFGGGILFFPVTFCIQDITTEVYGFKAARQMLYLSIISIIFYVIYSQIVIHLPTLPDILYQDNISFSIVFNTQPRQVIALLISLATGSIINDFFISRSKVILAGQYLWARILGSTMIGEAVLQVVGGVIGFSDKLDFKTQLLPNMIFAYGYKMLWCSATIPIIYMLTKFLKKKENIDVFDYDTFYNPLNWSLSKKNKL